MKFLHKTILLLLLLANMSVFAQTGEIHGVIYNFTEDSAVVKNIAVNFLKYHGHELLDDSSLVTETDYQGNFSMKNLPLDSTLLFYPKVTFNSVVYYGNEVRLTHKIPSVHSNVVVFDTTSDLSHIVFQMEHIFLEEEQGRVAVQEIFLIANTGKKTYLGSKIQNSNHNYVLKFPLPDKQENFELLTAETQNSVFVENNTLYDTDLLPPGNRQLSFRLQVPHSGKEWHYTRSTIYPTFGINIFLSQPEITIEGAGIMPMGEFPIKGKTYQRFSIQHLMPGMPLDIALKNLPAKSVQVQWIVLIAVGLLAILGFSYTFFKRPASAKVD